MSLSAGEQAAAVRCGTGWFRLRERALLEVSGADRVRWLNGMLSNDVAQLEPAGARSGCYALLLTPKGRIVADLHVLQRGDVFWLDLAADAAAPAPLLECWDTLPDDLRELILRLVEKEGDR